MSAEERIERLEREFVGMRRRARWLLGSGLGLVAALLVLPGYMAQDPKVVRAERFEVVNKEGKALAALTLHNTGLPSIVTPEAKNLPEVRALFPDELVLCLLASKAGQARIMLTTVDDWKDRLPSIDEGGSIRLSVSKVGPRIFLKDPRTDKDLWK